MTSKSVALLLADLGITRTHSRPHVSNDNPFSEAQFKTLKYRPDFPERFESAQDARAFCHPFFTWYNSAHHHAGIGLLTPATVHDGQAEAVRARRRAILAAAYAAHPDRFVHKPPEPPTVPVAVWINPPPGPVLPLPPSLAVSRPRRSPSEPLRGPRIDDREGGRYLGIPQSPRRTPPGRIPTAEVRH